MTKAYAVQWGFYSSNEGGSEWDSIWTTEDAAKKRIQDEVNERQRLSHISEVFKKYKDRKDLTTYTDGDYWIDYVEIFLDTEYMHGGNNE